MGVQIEPRLSKRMTCAVNVGAQRFFGVVLNVSQGGLFVQTAAEVQRGSSVDLELKPAGGEAIPLSGEVVWRRVVPAQLRGSAQGGMGVRILRADESYYTSLADWMRISFEGERRPAGSAAASAAADPPPSPAAAAPRPPPPEPVVTYRVRVRAARGPRTRSVCVEAASVEIARAEAARYAGEGWQVIEIEAL